VYVCASSDRKRHDREHITLPFFVFSRLEKQSKQRNTCLGGSGIPEETYEATYRRVLAVLEKARLAMKME
jgi:hypothetical protein